MQATASISPQPRSLGALVAAGCWLLAERAQVRAPLFPGTGCGAPVIPVSHGLGDPDDDDGRADDVLAPIG
jgi:hypothetical protein